MLVSFGYITIGCCDSRLLNSAGLNTRTWSMVCITMLPYSSFIALPSTNASLGTLSARSKLVTYLMSPSAICIQVMPQLVLTHRLCMLSSMMAWMTSFSSPELRFSRIGSACGDLYRKRPAEVPTHVQRRLSMNMTFAFLPLNSSMPCSSLIMSIYLTASGWSMFSDVNGASNGRE